MLEDLKIILQIQELDMKMLRLMRLKRERKKELDSIHAINADLNQKAASKEIEIQVLKREIKLGEEEVAEVQAKIKKFEDQQATIKKVDEFNALTHEMAAADRERINKEQKVSDLLDKLHAEEDLLKNLTQLLSSTQDKSRDLEAEIKESISQINAEGLTLKTERDLLQQHANPETLRIYERLFHNKKDRVVVPIENRCCSGCHILLTAQDENLVRRGERLVFCEHCSRIHYWPEQEELSEGEEEGTSSRRRRRSSKKTPQLH